MISSRAKPEAGFLDSWITCHFPNRWWPFYFAGRWWEREWTLCCERNNFLNACARQHLKSSTNQKGHQRFWEDVGCQGSNHRTATSDPSEEPDWGGNQRERVWALDSSIHGFESQLCPLRAVCPWPRCKTSLSILFLLCKLGLITLPLKLLWRFRIILDAMWALNKG